MHTTFVLPHVFVAISLWFFCLFVYEISLEPLNGFVPNSHGRRVWSLARTRLKVKGQGHQGQKKTFLALSSACVQFVFGKTSLASSFFFQFCFFIVFNISIAP